MQNYQVIYPAIIGRRDPSEMGAAVNPIALRMAKLYTILAILSAVGLKDRICSPKNSTLLEKPLMKQETSFKNYLPWKYCHSPSLK